jgi:hypothetical protein
MRLLALLLLPSCATLNTGWARVTYVEGRIAPVMTCAFRIDKSGDVEAICAAQRLPKHTEEL